MRPLNFDTVLIVRTDRDLRAALHGEARRRGTSASALVRKAIAASVEPPGPSDQDPPPAIPAAALRAAA